MVSMNSSAPPSPSPHQSVFVALDVPQRESALQLAKVLETHVGGFKIGLELFCSLGPSIVEEIGAQNTFLDLKLHDIPNTVAGSSRALARLGVQIFNMHCLGGGDMMRAGSDAARAENTDVKIIGVTILTSHDAASLYQLGLHEEPRDAVRRLALLARKSGLDGVVCSPQEIEAVRAECGDDFLIVTPGIRPASSAMGDQKRVMTPREALDKGASWLVIGRPITAASDPVAAAKAVFD
ncbi:MAG: orotidine-5-phosphate decarboxylase [Abditibacteriota bacterium]|nr:orotidine-5-phosphate decarboxylase [Abditibacteriota bacterium]